MNPTLKLLIKPNWNPNQRQAENVLRLVAAEYPGDLDEVVEIVKAKGLDVPDCILPANNWNAFH